jgi:hypothetical protein
MNSIFYDISFVFFTIKFRGLSPRPSDRCLSAKLMQTFADRGCHVVSVTDPHGRILGFLARSRYFFFQVAPELYQEAEKNLVGPGIEPGPLDLLSGTLTTRPQRRSFFFYN